MRTQIHCTICAKKFMLPACRPSCPHHIKGCTGLLDWKLNVNYLDVWKLLSATLRYSYR